MHLIRWHISCTQTLAYCLVFLSKICVSYPSIHTDSPSDKISLFMLQSEYFKRLSQTYMHNRPCMHVCFTTNSDHKQWSNAYWNIYGVALTSFFMLKRKHVRYGSLTLLNATRSSPVEGTGELTVWGQLDSRRRRRLGGLATSARCSARSCPPPPSRCRLRWSCCCWRLRWKKREVALKLFPDALRSECNMIGFLEEASKSNFKWTFLLFC